MPVKSIRLAVLFVLAGIACNLHAQSIIIPNWINLPQDTIVKNQLIKSLNGFLSQKEKSNKDNTYVLKECLLETSDLLDEIKGMGQNAKKQDKDFYKCYLTNLIKVDADNYIVQFSNIGVDDNTPRLRASFKLRAKRVGDEFHFYSPLKQNTIAWKIKKYSNLICYYKDTINLADAKAYKSKLDFYNKKLKAPVLPVIFYFCDNFTEVQQILGIEYKADYNGATDNNLTSTEDNMSLMVNGSTKDQERFNAHDLWHERLHAVMDRAIINRPVDEGCAYLYGGSWNYTWDEVLTKFKKYAADSPNADWLKLYAETTAYDPGSRPLITAYALNALIVQKIEREKGFASVLELLSCGPREKRDANYFKALEKLTGITQANFNTAMWALIKGS
jgi:hypothetical protein